jgi:cytochrome c biogenesis protein ResB
VAGRVVYYSWWFLALQGIFALNVALSIADLFPWGKKRIGFLVLHASLLLVFAGAAMTYFLKTEGQLFLWEGESGNKIVERGTNNKVVGQHELPFTSSSRPTRARCARPASRASSRSATGTAASSTTARSG